MSTLASAKNLKTRNREVGLDIGRYACAFGVIVAHALPTAPAMPAWSYWTWTGVVPALPLFYMTSGYLMFRNGASPSLPVIGQRVWRLALIYAFWLAAYCLLVMLTHVRPWSFPAHDWLAGGPAYHLWFIPALAASAGLVGGGIVLVGPVLTGVICAGLFGFALAGGTYHDLLHFPLSAGTRGGQLAAPFYVYVGAILGRRPFRPKLGWLVLGLVLAAACLAGEEWLTRRGPGSEPNNVALSAVGLATLLFLLAQRIPATRWTQAAARIGRPALGVYALHLALVWLLLPVFGNASLAQVLGMSILVFVVATAMSWAMSRVPGLSGFVR